MAGPRTPVGARFEFVANIYLEEVRDREAEISAHDGHDNVTFISLFTTLGALLLAIASSRLWLENSTPWFKESTPTVFLVIGLVFLWFPVNNLNHWLWTKLNQNYLRHVVAPNIRNLIDKASLGIDSTAVMTWEEFKDANFSNPTRRNVFHAWPISILRSAVFYTPVAIAWVYAIYLIASRPPSAYLVLEWTLVGLTLLVVTLIIALTMKIDRAAPVIPAAITPAANLVSDLDKVEVTD